MLRCVVLCDDHAAPHPPLRPQVSPRPDARPDMSHDSVSRTRYRSKRLGKKTTIRRPKPLKSRNAQRKQRPTTAVTVPVIETKKENAASTTEQVTGETNGTATETYESNGNAIERTNGQGVSVILNDPGNIPVEATSWCDRNTFTAGVSYFVSIITSLFLAINIGAFGALLQVRSLGEAKKKYLARGGGKKKLRSRHRGARGRTINIQDVAKKLLSRRSRPRGFLENFFPFGKMFECSEQGQHSVLCFLDIDSMILPIDGQAKGEAHQTAKQERSPRAFCE